MDILAHALWTNLAYYKKYKSNLKSRLWAVFFGIAPDLVSFTPATVYGLYISLFRHTQGGFMSLPSSSAWPFIWARESYNYTHSLVSFVVVLLLVTAIRKGKIYWPLFGWLLHIVIDIFTHPNFYQTPFLHPFSHARNHYAISWAEPHFMLVNYGLMSLFYIIIFIIGKRKQSSQQDAGKQ